MKVVDALLSISGYPMLEQAIKGFALVRELDLEVEATKEILSSKEYRLVYADSLFWLSIQPNISELDTQFDMSYSDRERMREQAQEIYGEYDDPRYQRKTKYGYKGNRI